MRSLKSSLKNRKQLAVIKNSASTTKAAVVGDPQGSIDGPLLFNTFKNDLVLFIQYTILGNYADDSNISISGSNKENLRKLMLSDFKAVTQ